MTVTVEDMIDPESIIEPVPVHHDNEGEGGIDFGIEGDIDDLHKDGETSDPETQNGDPNDDKDKTPLRFNSISKDTLVLDPKISEQKALIRASQPKSELEIALFDEIKRKDIQINRLNGEVIKLKQFLSKRKQVYKRKRKDDGAPTRALSAYNIFVQERFERLAKENEEVLMSTDADAQLDKIPPSRLVASSGTAWRELPPEEKELYKEKAKADKKRYEDEMAKYHQPDKQSARKRAKTGYNMFFTRHVEKLKESDNGVPSERGSVARLVGNAWKALPPEKKEQYEREADKLNGINANDEEDRNKQSEESRDEYAPNPIMTMDPNVYRPMIPPQMGHAPIVHRPPHHDPRIPYPPPLHGPILHGPYPYPPPPPPGYYQDFPPPPFAMVPPPQPDTEEGDENEGHGGQHPTPHPGHLPYPINPQHHHYHPSPHYHHHMEQRQNH